MNLHNITQKNVFESYIAPPPIISRCYTSKASAYASHLQGNSLYSLDGYLGNMRNISKKNTTFGSGNLKMPPLDHRTNEFCDPLVKIVGGFVGSKSQAGSTNHRGREFSLWDVIVDKMIDSMENPDSRQQGSRKSCDPGKKTDRIHKIESFTMIQVSRFDPECTAGLGTNLNFNCLEKEWFQPPKSEENGTVHGHNYALQMGAFHAFDAPNRTQMKYFASSRSCETSDCIETDIATCKLDEGPGRKLDSACQIQQELDQIASDTSDILPSNLDEPDRIPPPCSFEKARTLPVENTQHGSTSVLNGSGAVPKHILRPDAAEFTPRAPSRCRTSAGSESGDDDSIPADVLGESSPTSHTFLRPDVQRTLSECSADSDDSFIVFESAEDDPVILSEDSDDEDSCSDEDLDEIDNPILFPHNIEFSQPPLPFSRIEEANKRWAETYSDIKPSCSATKKVNFAAGSNLVKVKHLITWNFAHRAARKGPWEMYYRDSVRFKSRINALSAVLSPILAKRHRAKIYKERFQT